MSRPDRQDEPRLPRRPVEPDLDECCGTGCDPCVFDLYEERLQRWRARCNEIRAAHGLPPEEEPPC
ncbi:oxidoreductase-like domain-containing protein [Arhodomonas sp. AD133]|uniref:oxidoreductase-like domain-containing protein n=1 Tax=Arhodomonas sp. AD133 TaxID=3415009 RepID=UPI003EB72917